MVTEIPSRNARLGCELEPENSIPLFETADLESTTSGRNSRTPFVKPVDSNHVFKSFSELAQSLLDITPKGTARLRQHYLDRNSVHISEYLIGCSSTSEVFRGCLQGQDVAVKRLRMNVIRGETDARDLKDLITEIDLMCRLLRVNHLPPHPFVILKRESISKSNEMGRITSKGIPL